MCKKLVNSLCLIPHSRIRLHSRLWKDKWEGHASFAFSLSLWPFLSYHSNSPSDWEKPEEGVSLFHCAPSSHCHPLVVSGKTLYFPVSEGTVWALSIIAVKSTFPPSVLELMEEQNHWVIKLIWISNPSLRKSKLLFLDEPQGLPLNFSVHFPLLAYVLIRVPL